MHTGEFLAAEMLRDVGARGSVEVVNAGNRKMVLGPCRADEIFGDRAEAIHFVELGFIIKAKGPLYVGSSLLWMTDLFGCLLMFLKCNLAIAARNGQNHCRCHCILPCF